MYAAAVKAVIARLMERFNRGDIDSLLRVASPSAELCFPGDNEFASMFRPVVRGRAAHATHRGIDECRRFCEACLAIGVQFHVEDVMVAGPPWNLRVAARMHNFVPGDRPGDDDRYTNRFVACMTMRWGRLTAWEDYEDTQRVAEYLDTIGGLPGPAPTPRESR